MSNHRVKVSLAPLLIFCLLLGIGLIYGQIWNTIRKEIYHHPRGKILEKTPAQLGLPYEEVTFYTDKNITLKGWFIGHQDKAAKKCIILAPGKGDNRWSVLKYAPFLHQAGYNLLLFDPRSTGLSGGQKYGFGYFENRDIKNAYQYLKNVQGMNKMGILGFSAGASAAILAAAKTPGIGAVVADSPYANLKMAAGTYGEYAKDILLQALFPLYMKVASLYLGFDLYQKTNVLKQVAELPTPVLFIHGLKDKEVAPGNSKKLYQEKPKPKEIWLVPNTGHVEAFNLHSKDYRRKVISFFNKYL